MGMKGSHSAHIIVLERERARCCGISARICMAEDRFRYYDDPCRTIRGLGHPREPTPRAHPEGAEPLSEVPTGRAQGV